MGRWRVQPQNLVATVLLALTTAFLGGLYVGATVTWGIHGTTCPGDGRIFQRALKGDQP